MVSLTSPCQYRNHGPSVIRGPTSRMVASYYDISTCTPTGIDMRQNAPCCSCCSHLFESPCSQGRSSQDASIFCTRSAQSTLTKYPIMLLMECARMRSKHHSGNWACLHTSSPRTAMLCCPVTKSVIYPRSGRNVDSMALLGTSLPRPP
jgi:hypothetical protein